MPKLTTKMEFAENIEKIIPDEIQENMFDQIQKHQVELPILNHKMAILEALEACDIIAVVGAVGSGKSTQLPQFLYNAGYCSDDQLMGVVEPRRVNATCLAQHVAKELELNGEDRIAFYETIDDTNLGLNSKINFMTCGEVLNKLENDPLLLDFSSIIVDEADERSIFMDVILGLFPHIVTERRKCTVPLKLVIVMSELISWTKLNKKGPLNLVTPIIIDTTIFQKPFDELFETDTPEDYLESCCQKVSWIHQIKPDCDGILVFLSDQREVQLMVKKLRKMFPVPKETIKKETESLIGNTKNTLKGGHISRKRLLDYKKVSKDGESEYYDWDFEECSSKSQILSDNDYAPENEKKPLWVLPLYSLIHPDRMARVYKPPPAGCRLCVVATKIVELTVTVPNIKYVVDSGRVTRREYSKITGVGLVKRGSWISRMASERRAKCIRVPEGSIYRMYSLSTYNEKFEKEDKLEIVEKPVDRVLYEFKSLNLHGSLFPVPTSPDEKTFLTCEHRYKILEILKKNCNNDEDWRLSPMGRNMEKFLTSPKFAKVLLYCHKFDLLPYAVAIVAILSIPLYDETINTDKHLHSSFLRISEPNRFCLGDIMALLNIFSLAENAFKKGKLKEFCEKQGLNYENAIAVRLVRQQITAEINGNFQRLNLCGDTNITLPTDSQACILRQILLTGLADQIARKVQPHEKKIAGLDPTEDIYEIPFGGEYTYLSPSSVLYNSQPDWIIFQEKLQINQKTYLRFLTAIEPEWIPKYATSTCNIQILEFPFPYYNKNIGKVMLYVNSSYMYGGHELPITEIECPYNRLRACLFAKFFFEGEVFPKLNEYVNELLYSPNDFLLPPGKCTHLAVKKFFKALIEKEVDCKQKLEKIWLREVTYLLKEYMDWLPKSYSSIIPNIWPPSTDCEQ